MRSFQLSEWFMEIPWLMLFLQVSMLLPHADVDVYFKTIPINEKFQDDYFTMVIPSYEGRKDILKDSLDYIEKNMPPHLLEVIVVWNSDKDTFFSLDCYNFLVSVYFPENQSVASRFKPEIRTNCFFSYDDDIRMSVNDLERDFYYGNHIKIKLLDSAKEVILKDHGG